LLRQVVQNLDQAVVAVGVARHALYFQHELARVCGAQPEIAVPLARQRADGDGQPVEIARDTLGFRQT
jgi:hypothetical protein